MTCNYVNKPLFRCSMLCLLATAGDGCAACAEWNCDACCAQLGSAWFADPHTGSAACGFPSGYPDYVDTPIGIFQGQSDVGAALVPGSSTYDAASKQYTIHSAGYNIWYSRDEFRYLWTKMSGDVSLAGDVTFPDAKGYGDRKAVLVIRQSLADDSKEVVVGEHGVGMIHLAERPEDAAMMKDMQFRFGGIINGVMAKRIGIEKRGNAVTLYVSLQGEPMHPLGPPIEVPFKEPFYVGIGFCSHLPTTPDTAVLSNVVLENAAGKF